MLCVLILYPVNPSLILTLPATCPYAHFCYSFYNFPTTPLFLVLPLTWDCPPPSPHPHLLSLVCLHCHCLQHLPLCGTCLLPGPFTRSDIPAFTYHPLYPYRQTLPACLTCYILPVYHLTPYGSLWTVFLCPWVPDCSSCPTLPCFVPASFTLPSALPVHVHSHLLPSAITPFPLQTRL